MASCEWCVTGDVKIKAELIRLGGLAPKQLLKEVRAQGACVEILKSDRTGAPRGFHWGEAESPTGALSEVTQHKALMGKTLCEGEHKKSKNCTTIALAHDAPFSTLLHEWLHFQQTQKSTKVCATSKPLWSRTPNAEEAKLLSEFEWDALTALWESRKNLPLGVEDRITLSSEILEQAQKRKPFDPKAQAWTKREAVESYLMKAVAEFQGP